MAILHTLENIVGTSHILTGRDAKPFLVDWRESYHGQAQAIISPGNTDEVAAVVRACSAAQIPIVPQGGNTGLCGGATPDGSGHMVVLSLRRLNQIRDIDPVNDSMVVESGCILQTVQEKARDTDRLFPLSLAAEGSCTIGGALATNAGGTQVLRYGCIRDLCLGLEVVTTHGDIWHGLRGLRKDNTGYDLRNLFIGSEGTLGIITAATIKLYPLPQTRCTAFLALASMDDALAVLIQARRALGLDLTAFELMDNTCIALLAQHFPNQPLPFDKKTLTLPWFALLELSDHESQTHAEQRFENMLGQAIESELIKDAVIASNLAQSKALWHLRESVPLAEKMDGVAIKHDISIPISRMADFVHDTNHALQASFPGIRNVIFGHLGDGNLHYNVASGEYGLDALRASKDAIQTLVYDRVHALGGSISAEHGIGQLKRDALIRYKDPVEMALMRTLKQALDPQGIMNPGKVI